MTITLIRKLNNHFSVGLGYGKGSIDFQIKGSSSFWGFDFGNFEELNTNIDFNHLIDFAIYYNIHESKTITFLNTYGFGLSHYNITYSQSAYRSYIFDERYSGYYSGSKFISGYATYTSIDFIEWHPNKDERFSLIWGGKMHIASIALPQRNTLSNGYDVTTIDTGAESSGKMTIYDPEFSLRFNYYF